MKLEEQVPGTNKPPEDARREDALHDIVHRHAGLVYATALRQTGNHMLAEEITQNVFLALANKGMNGTGGGATLSSWLYRATLLEAKKCVRTELRRQRREQVAADLGTTSAQPEDSLWESLAPMLDEAIMSLKESDRLAVILRFFENKPLREVGSALGISDDTAQKRIARCLEQLTQFFRRRGFLVPALTASVPLLKSTTQAAPAAIMEGIVREIVRRGAVLGVSGASSWFLTLTTMSTIKTVIVCTSIVLLPVAWQWNEISHLHTAQASMVRQAGVAELELQDANARKMEIQSRMRLTENNVVEMRGKIHNATNSPLLTPAQPDGVLWSETSDYVRVPKHALQGLYIKALQPENGRYKLTDGIQSLLRLTPAESGSIMAALNKAQDRLVDLEATHVTPTTNQVTMASAGGTIDKVSYRVTPFAEEGTALRDELRSDLRLAIGDQREKYLWPNLAGDITARTRSFGSKTELVTVCLVDDGDPKTTWPKMLSQTAEWYSADGSMSGSSAGPLTDLATIPPSIQPVIDAWKIRAETIIRNNQKKP